MRAGKPKVMGHGGTTTGVDSVEPQRLIFNELLSNASMYSYPCRISIACASFTINHAGFTGIAKLGVKIKELLMEAIPELLLNLAWGCFKAGLKGLAVICICKHELDHGKWDAVDSTDCAY